MTLAIIDYGSGNLHSVQKACEKVAGDLPVIVTSSPDDVLKASHIILPGVGAYSDCVQGLKALDGMVQALEQRVLKDKIPFLGICVGMQMLFQRGYEHGEHAGLGWLEGEVRPMKKLMPAPECDELSIPHMGWNSLDINDTAHPLFAGIEQGADVYFVHSYAAAQSVGTLATTDYGVSLCAAVAKGNIAGTQFHPEKSQQVGLQLLKNFVSL